MNRKQRQVQRYQQQLKHFKTRAERKQLDELSKERKSRERRSKPTARADEPGDMGDMGDSGELFEKMKAHRGRPRSGREVQDTLGRVTAQARGELDALVLAVHRGRVELLVGERRESVPVPASMSDEKRGRFVVGDRVTLTRAAGDALRIRTVEPRSSELARPDPSDARRKHVIAANIDAAVIVTSARSPAFKPGLIDRFLIVLRQGGVAPVVCVNKIDLVSAEERRLLVERLAVYRSSAEVVQTSSASGAGLDALRSALSGRTVVFVGQSGVGKSSLLNALAPDLQASTGAVRARDGKGCHTTTGSNLYELGDGTRVIDTPGIRSLALAGLGKADLALEFPELAPLAAGCRFRDCLHAVEPGCGVRAAVEAGELDAARYESYLRILASLEE